MQPRRTRESSTAECVSREWYWRWQGKTVALRHLLNSKIRFILKLSARISAHFHHNLFYRLNPRLINKLLTIMQYLDAWRPCAWLAEPVRICSTPSPFLAGWTVFRSGFERRARGKAVAPPHRRRPHSRISFRSVPGTFACCVECARPRKRSTDGAIHSRMIRMNKYNHTLVASEVLYCLTLARNSKVRRLSDSNIKNIKPKRTFIQIQYFPIQFLRLAR